MLYQVPTWECHASILAADRTDLGNPVGIRIHKKPLWECDESNICRSYHVNTSSASCSRSGVMQCTSTRMIFLFGAWLSPLIWRQLYLLALSRKSWKAPVCELPWKLLNLESTKEHSNQMTYSTGLEESSVQRCFACLWDVQGFV